MQEEDKAQIDFQKDIILEKVMALKTDYPGFVNDMIFMYKRAMAYISLGGQIEYTLYKQFLSEGELLMHYEIIDVLVKSLEMENYT